jgi:hypothetical protein
MSPRLRFLSAGFLALATVAVYWVYAGWPEWRGTEIYLPVLTRTQRDGSQWLEFPDQRLDPGFSAGTRAAAAGTSADAVYVPVRAIGNLWDAAAAVDRNTQRLRGRIVFVQVQPVGSPISGGWTAWRPVSVSDDPIDGEVNLRAHVQNADAGGRLDVRYAAVVTRVPADPAGDRATVDWKKAPVGPGGAARDVEPITSAYAVLKVLPSGRHVVVAMIVAGKRVPG